jgi:hypothetical protein
MHIEVMSRVARLCKYLGRRSHVENGGTIPMPRATKGHGERKEESTGRELKLKRSGPSLNRPKLSFSTAIIIHLSQCPLLTIRNQAKSHTMIFTNTERKLAPNKAI